MQWVQHAIIAAEHNGVVKISPPMLARVFNMLSEGMVNLANGRKIMEFPIPFPLAQMITVMLLFHGIAVPLICATTIATIYWACFLCFVVCFSYWTINYIATELEMPFGEDANDLPLSQMLCDMNQSLMTLLTEHAAKCPEFEFHDTVTSRPGVMSLNFNEEFRAESLKSHPTVIFKHGERRSDIFREGTSQKPDRQASSRTSRSNCFRRQESQESEEQHCQSQEKKNVQEEHPREMKEGMPCMMEGESGFPADAESQQEAPNTRNNPTEETSKADNTQVSASALSQLQGFCDFRAMVLTPRQPEDLEAIEASVTGQRASRPSTRSRSQNNRSDASTVIQVRAAACCMPLTPGARLDVLPSSYKQGAARRFSPPGRGNALSR